MGKVIGAWVVWLVAVAVFVFLVPPGAVSLILLTVVGAGCLVLIYQGQRKLPLWANITLLLVQSALGLIFSMPWLLVVMCIYLTPNCGHP